MDTDSKKRPWREAAEEAAAEEKAAEENGSTSTNHIHYIGRLSLMLYLT